MRLLHGSASCCIWMLLALGCNGEELRTRLRAAAQSGAPKIVPLLGAGSSLELGAADMVGAADLNGDGLDELVRFSGEMAILGDQQWPLGGRAQRVVRADLEGDGDEEILVATGMGRDFPEATVRLWAIHSDHTDLIYEADTERNQVTDLQVHKGKPLLSLFVSAKQVEGRLLTPEGPQSVHQGAMAMQQRMVGADLVVGRLYGDAPKSHGDLSVYRGEQPPIPLPSLRGIRAISSADLDGDDRPELLVSDGWHYAYGEHGDARLVAFTGPNWSDSRVLAWSEEDYSFRGIEPMEIDGRIVILLSGSHGVYLVQQDSLSWDPVWIGKGTEIGNSVFRRTPSGISVVVAGNPAQQISLEAQ